MVESGEGAQFQTISELTDATKVKLRPDSLMLESIAEDPPTSLKQKNCKLITVEPNNYPFALQESVDFNLLTSS